MELREHVIEALRQVHDPEISINVVDLGLIYELDVVDSHCEVRHTLTSMMCPFADQICEDIREAILSVDGIETANTTLVFDPPFSIDMVPEDTKLVMGWA